MSNPEIKSRILNFLKKHYPKDFNIQEIVNVTKFSRGTVSTYLKVLRAEGDIVITRTMGKYTLYAWKKSG